MSASPSPVQPDADATGRAKRAAAAIPGLLLALALTSLAGLVAIAGTTLTYDARGGLGPLGSVNGSILRIIGTACFFVVAPVTCALATWRLGWLGAIAVFLGMVVLGPLLWWTMFPWSSVDSSARYGYYDEGRGWVLFSLFFLHILSLVIVTPIILIARWAWRHFRHAT